MTRNSRLLMTCGGILVAGCGIAAGADALQTNPTSTSAPIEIVDADAPAASPSRTIVHPEPDETPARPSAIDPHTQSTPAPTTTVDPPRSVAVATSTAPPATAPSAMPAPNLAPPQITGGVGNPLLTGSPGCCPCTVRHAVHHVVHHRRAIRAEPVALPPPPPVFVPQPYFVRPVAVVAPPVVYYRPWLRRWRPYPVPYGYARPPYGW